MVYLIEGGYANTYLVQGEDGWVAVDVGSPLAAKKVATFITESLNRKRHELKLITATHFHIDHIGGICRLLTFFPRAEVNFSFHVSSYLTGKEKLGIPPFSSWITGFVPTAARLNHHLRNLFQVLVSTKSGIPLPFLRNIFFLSYKPKCELKEGLTIPFLPDWRVIETPGHTQDSISFYHAKDRVLICGDTILNMKGTGELNNFCCSREEIKKSFKKLSILVVENIYPGHGVPINGVKKALSKVRSLDKY